jgi:eukaryotic-like serine/threonine-protein kinase
MQKATRSSRALRSLRFADFEVDLRAAELRRNGTRVHLQEQPFKVLALLLEHAGEVVTREELRLSLWPSDTFVDFDTSLNTAINKVREAIGDSADKPRFVETLPRQGYRFVGDINPTGGSARSAIEVANVAETPRQLRRIFGVLLALVVIAVLLVLLKGINSGKVPATIRFEVYPPDKQEPWLFSLSPDGRHLAFTSGGLLWIRSLDTVQPQPLPGTEGAGNALWSAPFWSPDGRFIGFFADGKLKKIQLGGGPPETLCAAPSSNGGTWSSNGTILFVPDIMHPAIFRVSSAGGQPIRFSKPDASAQQMTQAWPSFLPDGRHFLYLAGLGSGQEGRGIYLSSLDSSQTTRLVASDSRAVYAPPGYLLFLRNRILLAQPFDATTLRVTGEAVPLAQDILYEEYNGFAGFSVSQSGVLAYVSSGATPARHLVWFDRTGKQVGTVGEPAPYTHVELSPDEKHVAVELFDHHSQIGNIWVLDLARGTSNRLSLSSSWEYTPVWSPDGTKILFDSNRDLAKGGSGGNLFIRSSTGTGPDHVLVESDSWKWPNDWSRDGRFVLFSSIEAENRLTLWVLPLLGNRKPRLIQTVPSGLASWAGLDLWAKFSPDGHWLAYVSGESGREEIFVQSFPESREKWQISVNGGTQPRWRRDGRELFYVATDGKLMVVEVKLSPKFQVGTPRALFDSHLRTWTTRYQYAVTAEGQRFLAIIGEDKVPPIIVTTNWIASLKR